MMTTIDVVVLFVELLTHGGNFSLFLRVSSDLTMLWWGAAIWLASESTEEHPLCTRCCSMNVQACWYSNPTQSESESASSCCRGPTGAPPTGIPVVAHGSAYSGCLEMGLRSWPLPCRSSCSAATSALGDT